MSEEVEHRRADANRLALLEALLYAVDHRSEVFGAIDEATSREDAETRLMTKFGWDEQIVVNVLGLRAWYFTRPGRQEIEDEALDKRFALGLPDGRKQPPKSQLKLPRY